MFTSIDQRWSIYVVAITIYNYYNIIFTIVN